MKKFTLSELERIASHCFGSFDNYWDKFTAFKDDYIFFKLYMKRNSKSDITFIPSTNNRSLNSLLNNYYLDEDGLRKIFCIYYIMRQIIKDLQPWGTSLYTEYEHKELLNYLTKHEYVDIDLFCDDFVGCSSAQSDVRNKISEFLKGDEE